MSNLKSYHSIIVSLSKFLPKIPSPSIFPSLQYRVSETTHIHEHITAPSFACQMVSLSLVGGVPWGDHHPKWQKDGGWGEREGRGELLLLLLSLLKEEGREEEMLLIRHVSPM